MECNSGQLSSSKVTKTAWMWIFKCLNHLSAMQLTLKVSQKLKRKKHFSLKSLNYSKNPKILSLFHPKAWHHQAKPSTSLLAGQCSLWSLWWWSTNNSPLLLYLSPPPWDIWLPHTERSQLGQTPAAGSWRRDEAENWWERQMDWITGRFERWQRLKRSRHSLYKHTVTQRKGAGAARRERKGKRK